MKTTTKTGISTGTKVAVAIGLLAVLAYAAVRLILPGELAKHAISEGTKSVTPAK